MLFSPYSSMLSLDCLFIGPRVNVLWKTIVKNLLREKQLSHENILYVKCVHIMENHVCETLCPARD